MSLQEVGIEMHRWAEDLFPINRSITGDGTRATLDYIKKILPKLTIHSIPSGVRAFDWVVPDEWIVRNAYVVDEAGIKIIDFKVNNLHLVGYSERVDKWCNLEELNEHLFSLPDQPNAIPYVTSYYAKRWGFCITHRQRETLKPGRYRVVIDSDLKAGVLNYGELILPGASDKEVMLSTYICHPSMANNELSGPVVTTALARLLISKDRYYTYRIIFIPETIGSIVYLSHNVEHLKKQVIAGFNITCVGDDRCYSFLPSRDGNTLSDRVALHVLNHVDKQFKRYSWLDRGSDERQYCAPGVDLPIATIMRSKYGEYPEYHTSLDDLRLVTPEGLSGGFNVLKQAIEVIENNFILTSTILCEPQLGKRGLYPTLSTKESGKQVSKMMNLISYCDGRAILDIADLINVPAYELLTILKPLIDCGLVKASRSSEFC
jgi:aminopeptidase-like protein